MKILLVEDNAKLNEAIRIYLDENGFTVDTAFNGVQALSKVKDLKKKNEEYDVIILDRMMPMKDGIETLRDIKNMEIGSGVIILTAKDTVDDKVFGLAAGADDYMVKPFNVKELMARIHSLYRRNLIKKDIVKNNSYTNSNDSEFKEFSNTKDIENDKIEIVSKNKDLNFSFNLNSGEIVLEKENDEKTIIYLTGKESNIFKILLEKNNTPISKDSILEKIWNESEAPSSRFVDVHVHNLRNKLLKNNFPGRVETVRNSGYKLILD
ncbi:MAG: response regulator transcription factor [Candidatus Nomurabacteria bacterium]